MAAVQKALLVLRPRPWKWVRIAATGLLFVAGGVFMQGRAHDATAAVKAWAVIVFFGLLTVVALLQFLPGINEVVVTDAGLHLRTVFKRLSIPWSDIERFGVSEFRTQHGPFTQKHRQVGILYTAEAYARQKQGRAGAWAQAIVGYHGALPDNYGYAHQELADLLQRYLEASRNAAIGSAPHGPSGRPR